MQEILDNTAQCNCSIPPVFPDIKWLYVVICMLFVLFRTFERV